MATYTNPPGSPPVTFNGRTAFTHEELAAACRKWGPQLHTPPGIDGARLLWAFAGKESSFGADCRPRHEQAYCSGRYASNAAVQRSTRAWGHAAHCSFGPWQMLYVNDSVAPNPELFGNLDFAAARTVAFFNESIFGHQRVTTVQQAALAWNTGDWFTLVAGQRVAKAPTDYSEAVQHLYDTATLPAAITLHASAANDAADLYNTLCDAIEGLGLGLHAGALTGVPVLVQTASDRLQITGSTVQWVSDEHGKRVDCIALDAS